MELDSIHHLALQVKEIDRALQWYRSNFECEVIYQDPSWALLKFKNIHLALVVPDQHPSHIAFLRDNIAQYGEIQEHRDGSRSVYIEDTEGNAIELLDAASMKR